TTPDVATLLGGFNAAVVGVIGAITLKMARTAVGRLWQMGVAAGALLFSVLGDAPPGEVALLAIGVGLAVDLGTKRARLLAMERQFADAVAIGKLTPGPVLLLATFIGYLRHGWLGAVVATIGIFAAPFALVATAGTWLDRIRSRRPVRAALRGLTPAVLGLMAAAVISLGDTINGEGEIAIAIAVGLTLSRFEINPAVMLALGGAAR